MTTDTKEVLSQTNNHGVFDEHSRVSSTSCHSLDVEEAGLPACRVCQCAESDKRGDAALEFLGITPTLHHNTKKDDSWKDVKSTKNGRIEFVSPDGEVFVCNTTDDVEMGLDHTNAEEVVLVELGCSCKNDLSLVHYACALKWFVNHGSTICEICECVAKNITISDLKKVVSSLKEYELLRERTANGVLENPASISSSGVDPDAVAAIRRQRLSEISLWFGPHNNNSSNSARISQPERNSVVFDEQQHEVVTAENPATKWVVEGTGILLATGLLTVTLAWLIAPHVGKKTAKSGLHILLGGICAVTVVVFFRFFVLTRIKYGPARYWAILFIFWFLVFGIWASRTHGAHAT